MQNSIRILGFRTTYHKRAGSVELVPRDWVKFAPLHNPTTVTEEMVNFLKPPADGLDRDDEGLKEGYMNALWVQIEPHYEAWKKGTTVPEHGIPLSAWAGVTAEQADVFRAAGIRTVEDIAGMSESQMGKVNLPGVRTFKTMANEFLDSRKGAETASKMTALEEQNAALKEQLDHMASLIADLRDRDRSEDAPPVKRGPGRPKKTDTVEEAA